MVVFIPQAIPTSHRTRHGLVSQTSTVPMHDPATRQSSSQRKGPEQVNVLPAQVVSVHCIAVGPDVVSIVWFGHPLDEHIGRQVLPSQAGHGPPFVWHVPPSRPHETPPELDVPASPPPVPTSSELSPEAY